MVVFSTGYFLMKLGNVALPNGLQWVDEFTNVSTLQSSARTLDGGLVVFHRQLIGGKLITLESLNDTGWVNRTTLQGLRTLADAVGTSYILEIRDTQYTVIFRHADGALDAEPVFPTGNNPPSNTYYLVKIRLMTT